MVESVAQNGAGGFGRIAESPECRPKSPANLDLRSDGVQGDKQHPSDELGRSVGRRERPIAQAIVVGPARALFDEGAMGVRVRPGPLT